MERIPIIPVKLGQVKGLMQAIDDELLNPAYSSDCQNIDVSDGIISTRQGSTLYVPALPAAVTAEYTICKIMKFTNSEHAAADTDYMIVGLKQTDGAGAPAYKWFAYYSQAAAAIAWNEITEDDYATETLRDIDPENCSWLMYILAGVPIIILTTDSKTKKIWIAEDGTDLYFVADDLGGAPTSGEFITLHRERVWMANNSAAKNTAYWCHTYDPEDWSTAGEAGNHIFYTRDNDEIIQITNWLDDVIIIKTNTLWRVLGDANANYEFEQIYAVQGAVYGRSACSDGAYCFFAGEDGIYQYDGTSAYPILTNEIKTVYTEFTSPRGLVANNKLYMWDRQTITGATGYTGKCIVYDVVLKTISVYYIGTMYDCIVSDGEVLFTNGANIYSL